MTLNVQWLNVASSQGRIANPLLVHLHSRDNTSRPQISELGAQGQVHVRLTRVRRVILNKDVPYLHMPDRRRVSVGPTCYKVRRTHSCIQIQGRLYILTRRL